MSSYADGLHGLLEARSAFLTRLKSEVLYEREPSAKVLRVLQKRGTSPDLIKTTNTADISNTSSSVIAFEWGRRLPGTYGPPISEQASGSRFAVNVAAFLETGVGVLKALTSCNLRWKREHDVTNFDQYQHLAIVSAAFEKQPELKTIFGEEYLIKPDITLARVPVDPDHIGGRPSEPVAKYAPLLADAELGKRLPLLIASVSCKLTIRSDRAQNTRTEALNLIRNRKGRSPAIVAVTAEPFPNRLASLAMGTGDIDCVYHAALYELQAAVASSENEDQAEMLETLIGGRRLRDISDLVVDLLI